MLRSPLAIVAVAALSVGCVTISGPTASPAARTPPATTPAATPTKAPTTAPTVAPTVAPSATTAPTTAPTAVPTVAPTVEPTAGPTSAPQDFDQRDLLFTDDFTDTSSGWATGTVTGSSGQTVGTIDYQHHLRFDLQESNGWLATSRVTDGDQSVMRMVAEFIPQGASRFGLLCDSEDTDEWGAIVDTDGTWLLGDLTDNGFDSKVKDENSGLNIPISQSTVMAVECSSLATGKVRITLWLDGTGPVAVYETNSGPDTFNRVGIYAEAGDAPTSVDVANVLAFGNGSADGSMNDAALELMTHVPTDWADSCYQSLRPPLYGDFAEAVVTCFIRKPGASGAEVAEYASYLSPDAMNAAYQKRLDTFGPAANTGSCQNGSNETTWNFGEGTPDNGKLLCIEQFRGVRFDWTDNRLNILSSLVDFDGSFPKTYADWVNAGPNL